METLADWVVRCLFVVVLSAGVVKVMDVWEWWATRKQRRAAVRVQVRLDVDDDPGEWLDALHGGRVWIDVPPLATIDQMRQRFPEATYRMVEVKDR